RPRFDCSEFSLAAPKGGRMLGTRKLGTFLVVSSLALGFAAGLAVGQMKPPAENKGLGAEALRSLDLTEEIDSVKGHALRMRRITLAPGGVIGLHSHKDRPAVWIAVDIPTAP